LEKFNQIIAFVKDFFSGLTAEQKRQLVIIFTVFFAAFLTFFVIISLINPKSEDLPSGPERINILSPIPAEDIFMPDEPDYIPGVILERQQRSIWSMDDASVFWRDPLMFGEEQWREKIEEAVNELMERVP
jgi:hypothetical protein